MITVRLADSDDLPALLDMMEEHYEVHKDHTICPPYFSRPFAEYSLSESMKQNTHTHLVAVSEKQVVGFIWVQLSLHPCCAEYRWLTEVFLYVKSELRDKPSGGKALRKLLREARYVAQCFDCDYVQLGNLAGNKKLDATYEKRYEKLGTLYKMNVEDY